MGVTIPLLVGVMAAVEATLLFVVSVPATRPVRAAINGLVLRALQPLLFAVPMALILLLDVYEKQKTIKDCRGDYCSAADRDRYKKAEMKNQRNLILSLSVIFLYWILWRMAVLQSYILRLEAAKPPAKHPSPELLSPATAKKDL